MANKDEPIQYDTAMIKRIITNTKTGQKLIMLEEGEFEYEEPIKHYYENFIVEKIILNEELNKIKNGSHSFSGE